MCETLTLSLTRAPAAAQPWSEGPQNGREALLGPACGRPEATGWGSLGFFFLCFFLYFNYLFTYF